MSWRTTSVSDWRTAIRSTVVFSAPAVICLWTVLDTVEALLAGVPADVKAVYSTKTLGPLLDSAGASHRVLLETLEVFLGLNCSWARTAETLNLHVNTVHYRIQRIEALTGRDLSRLDHKLDLRAALLCR
ncbi:PucR family transcriptional regulator [Streptomyces sp. NBC_01353]|uniref:PucR family transcriptional regulator n=1 Tax=Streptomyces sp. NBC_01353 TaxID=2903835 RepID=UPI003DA2E0EE